MASEKNLNAVFTDIANAIRGKKGTTEQFQPINMAEEIVNLPSGGGETIELSVTQNGTYVPDEGTTYSKVSVSVPQTAESGTLKALFDVTKSCNHLFNGYTGTRIDGIFLYSDTSNVTSMNYMFAYSYSLASIPLFDTSSVTSMKGMFYFCQKLTSVPLFDMSSVTDAYEMFSRCTSLITIPQFDTSSLTKMDYMFYQCTKLTTIPQLNVSNVTSFSDGFYNCVSLKTILMYGMKANLNISSSTKFEESDLVTILNNLATVTSTQTLTMGSTNLAKLTDEEKAIATNKGWTLK